MLTTEIKFFGQDVISACDMLCEKAWGMNSRPKVQLSEDEDDYAYLADSELGEAPADPGTYEGDQGKPFHPARHNKWCVRECERCDTFERGESIVLADFSVRVCNIAGRKD